MVTVATEKGPVIVSEARVEESRTRRTTTTDRNGFYSISGLQATNNVVTVSKAGYVSGTRPVTINSDTRLDIEVTPRSGGDIHADWRGVRNDREGIGTLIQGVQLYCDGCGSELGHTFMYTDSNGLYSFSWLYPGYQTLLVSKEGYRTPPGQTFSDLHHDRDG